MRQSFSGQIRRQVGFLRRQFLQGGELPFAGVLSADLVAQALAAIGTLWYDRVYTPLVTLWLFLGQALSPDPSCRAAVARLNADRAARGQRPCSARTGAYCQARKRLPERLVADLARRAGRALDADADPKWLWKGRRVYVYDGSHASMPDTPANQAEYPQPDTQKPGLGFPLARLAAVFSLATGAGAGPGDRPVRWQGAGRAGDAPDPLGHLPPRRRRAGRPPHVRLDRAGHARAARGRLGVPAHVPPEVRLPPGPPAGPGRPRRRVAQAQQPAVDRPGDIRTATRVAPGPRDAGAGRAGRVPDDGVARRRDAESVVVRAPAR